ncbi:MAG: hypothetical protein DRH08_14675 [Deltaproteobacteria bacterium]|nr:MAG: hypothetical protein DRH08_14675 [Deltaproteobacteria bacterium]
MTETLFNRALKNEFDVDDMDWLLKEGYFVFRKTDKHYYHIATRRFTYDSTNYIRGGAIQL